MAVPRKGSATASLQGARLLRRPLWLPLLLSCGEPRERSGRSRRLTASRLRLPGRIGPTRNRIWARLRLQPSLLLLLLCGLSMLPGLLLLSQPTLIALLILLPLAPLPPRQLCILRMHRTDLHGDRSRPDI